MKKIRCVAMLLVLVLMSSMLFACSRSDDYEDAENNDTYESPQDYENEDDEERDDNESDNLSAQGISLVEITSTGEISYDDFLVDFGFGVYIGDTDLFPFRYNSRYGYADAEGNVVIRDQYDRGYMFSEDKAFVIANNQCKVINTSGEELYTLPDEYFDAADSFTNDNSFFKNGKAIVSYVENIEVEGDYSPDCIIKALIIHEDMHTEEISIPTGKYLIYRTVNTPEFAGFTASYSVGTDNVFALFDLTGREIWKLNISSDGFPTDTDAGSEYYIAMKKSRIDTGRIASGMEAMKVQNGYVNIFDENMKWGLLDVQTGEVVIDCKYDFLGGYLEGLCNICSYGKWGYVDLSGNEVIKPEYKYTNLFVNGSALVVQNDDLLRLIDNQNNIMDGPGISLSKGTSSYYNEFYNKVGQYDLSVIYNPYVDYKIVTDSGEIILKGSLQNIKNEVLALTDNYIFIGTSVYKIVK